MNSPCWLLTNVYTFFLQVAYLSLVSWNDSRQENEDRLRSSGMSKAKAKAATSILPSPSAFSKDDDEEKRPKKKSPKAAATPKGFGKQ